MPKYCDLSKSSILLQDVVYIIHSSKYLALFLGINLIWFIWYLFVSLNLSGILICIFVDSPLFKEVNLVKSLENGTLKIPFLVFLLGMLLKVSWKYPPFGK